MRVVERLEDLATAAAPLVLAAGAFDGVHRGHQSVITAARASAARCGGEAWVLTFEPHPLRVLRPAAAPPLLTDTPHKLTLLGALGVDGVALVPFTPELAALEPEAFVARLCDAAPGLSGVVVGENWTFGHRARGTFGFA